MRCIYKEFRRGRDNWKVEYSGNVNINIDVSDAVLTPEEASFLRNMKSKLEKRKKSKSSPVSVIRKSEESSDYSTSKEFKKLFEDLENTTTSEDEDVQYNTNPYKALPDVLLDSRKVDMKYHCSSEEDQEPCSSQQAADLEERFRKLRETEDCSGVVIADNSDETCRAYKTERNSRKKKKKSRKERSKRVDMELVNEEIRDLLPHEQGYFELRQARGRIRLKLLEKSRNQNSTRIEFSTLNEILVERGIPADTVICCILCRLLILNTVREEFFMSPCDCTDKFVHSKCALLYQSEMVRQKCYNCNKFYTDRILCRSRAPTPSKLEELELHLLNSTMTKEITILKEERTLYSRLPAEFEHGCFICFDCRTIREDIFEKLDSTIVKACRCTVTAHNECLVKSLLLRRSCRYCNYRYKIETVGVRIGFFNTQLVSTYGVLVALVCLIGIFFVCLIPNLAINVIVQNSLVALILVTSIYLIFSVMRVWRKKSRQFTESAKVSIKPYTPSNAIAIEKFGRKRKISQQHEEIPFKEMEKRYTGRSIQRILQNWNIEMA